ncbi:DUF4188 domain-containing protein [Kitasatospora sp. NPDC048239]|uniref:DUF4188 domain-containing protein n=1 Tax=Kitasatospora sp. NPDC048239 TaxID=3364046 RepID=UPI003723C2C0
MGDDIRNGRFSVDNKQDITLFVFGIRVNRFRAVGRWLPVLRAMKPMIRELTEDADSGLLGYRTYLQSPRELMVMQYWRSTKELLDYSQGATHRQAWTDFYRLATAGAAVGIWHELYAVPAGRYSAIYGIVPELGLAEFADLKPVGRRNATTVARLGEG